LKVAVLDRGDSDVEIRLGYMYENGLGVPKDPQEAVRWYRKAAETADRIPPSHLWQGRESQVLTLKTPRGIAAHHPVR
jgi:TPR repeat protein